MSLGGVRPALFRRPSFLGPPKKQSSFINLIGELQSVQGNPPVLNE
jgi:hypothetical protein